MESVFILKIIHSVGEPLASVMLDQELLAVN